MNLKILSLLLVCGLMTTPSVMFAADNGAIVGGGVGGAVGAAIGHDMNGRNGAIIGAAIGGATGAAIGTNQSRSQPQQVVVKERVSYRDNVRHDNGKHRGWHKKGHGHHRHHD
ncbi:MAG: glycine zipper 2TM domain-containing protein [Moraxellaceae bacterium]|nr:glycine zipper 2TM domain-containing protein [Moraxellaceae bacterium]